MSKNPNKMSRKDNAQIQKAVYCEQHDALRVIHANDIETSFSLNHKEDSIVAKAACRPLKAGETHDCSDITKIQAYQSGMLSLFSEDDQVIVMAVEIGKIYEICALTLKSSAPLVGR